MYGRLCRQKRYISLINLEISHVVHNLKSQHEDNGTLNHKRVVQTIFRM